MRMYEDDYYDGPTLIEQLIEEKRRKGLLPKTSYTKDEVMAMLTELQIDIEKHTMISGVTNQGTWNECIACCSKIVQQKIDKLRGEENVDKA